MIDLLGNLGTGIEIALTPVHLFYCFLGVVLGTLIGVLPGLGPVATIAMLLPITFNLDAISALIMLAGIYYGAQYGGSTTAILVNLPGEASSTVTCLDGHALTRQGRAGAALAIAALASFAAGCVGTLAVALLGPTLANLALRFQSPEYFSLMVLGLVTAVVLARGSVLKAVIMVLLGLLLSQVGTDASTGTERFVFGNRHLVDGLNFAVVATGLFGIGEILSNLYGRHSGAAPSVGSIGRLWPSRSEFRSSIAPTVRGSVLGCALGLLPGSGPLLSSFGAYALEKRLSRTPGRFGHGAVEGVAAPEAANNAAAQTSFIPMLTLGIPSNSVMALMIGAMIIHGITPGPQVLTEQPDLFWAMVASMWVGNVLLVVLNLPLVGIWVRLLTVPYHFLYPAILLFVCIGAYSISNSYFDVMLAAGFGLVGFLLRAAHFDPAPLLLGLILGEAMEDNLRRTLIISREDLTILFTRPVSAGMLALAAVLLIGAITPGLRTRREKVFAE
ncbi:MAG TPA: tripartite tricarboxylate transporter permease [Microvirga sp.]|jgi:putative tricarboxylic transport membrane protein|nr:tripartite tricarboxylate transporter permease [Microvirga sp.]